MARKFTRLVRHGKYPKADQIIRVLDQITIDKMYYTRTGVELEASRN